MDVTGARPQAPGPSPGPVVSSSGCCGCCWYPPAGTRPIPRPISRPITGSRSRFQQGGGPGTGGSTGGRLGPLGARGVRRGRLGCVKGHYGATGRLGREAAGRCSEEPPARSRRKSLGAAGSHQGLLTAAAIVGPLGDRRGRHTGDDAKRWWVSGLPLNALALAPAQLGQVQPCAAGCRNRACLAWQQLTPC